MPPNGPITADAPIDTLFLLGSGIASGGWAPVLKAINQLFGDRFDVKDAEEGNFVFAYLVGQLRHYSAWTKKPGTSSRQQEAIAKAAEEAITQLRELKSLIGKHLVESVALRQVTVREEFIRVASRFKGSAAYITTNWDLLLEQELHDHGQEARIVHIHGRADDPQHMLLPMEVVHEPYRTPAEVEKMQIKFEAWHLFERAKRVVIYGLSLSPLDAEIGQLLSLGLQNSQYSGGIEVYDLPGQAARVARRVRLVVLNDGRSYWQVIPHAVSLVDASETEDNFIKAK